MSHFADTVFRAKYSMNGTEEWEDTAKRVATNVLGAINASEETIEIVEKLIRDRVFMPGGRYLYAAGREFHQTQNCFSAETRIITDKGIFSFEELAGTAVNVLNKYGEWEQAEIHCFGEQDLLKLTLENDDEIFVTENHRWWQSDGSRVTTNELKEVMLLEPKMDIELDEIGIRHGIIFGDGHLIFRNMNLGVRSIEETNRTELVYCAVVKGSESFTLANGVVTSNCLLMRAEDSREGWADLMAKSAMALQTGAGIGIDYSLLRGAGAPIRRTGGVASGPISLMKMINEIGRGVMQGGSRRCIPEGGHIMTSNGVMRVEDVVKGDFVVTTSGMREVIGTVSQGKQKTVVVKTRLGQMKITGNHRVAVLTSPTTYGWVNAADLKPEHRLIAMPEIVAGSPQELPAPSNDGRGRNSVIPMMPKLDTEVAWFIGYIAGNGNASYSEYTNDRGYKFHKGRLNITVPSHRTSVIERLSKCFDMFGVNHSVSDYDTYVVLKCTHSAFGKWMFDNVKQPNTTIRVPDWILQAPPEIRGAFVAGVVDSDGSYETRPLNAVTTVYPEFCEDIQSVLMSLGVLSRMKKFERENPEWKTRYSLGVVSSTEVDKFNQMVGIHAEKGQYVSAGSKRQFGYTYPWEMKDSLPKIHSNKGCGFNYETVASKIDTLGVPIEVLSVEEGDVVETFDLQVDGVAEFSYNGIIVHNSAIWAGLSWDHPDVHAFIHAKDWSDVVRKQKEIDFNFPGDLDMTNISVILDKEFFDAYYDELHPKHQIAVDVYWDTTRQMLSTAEPGFSINYENKNESLRNACQPAHATILTPNGISTIGDLKIGDVIWSGSGWTKVVNKWFTGTKPVNKYVTSAGYFIGTDNHRIVQNGSKIEVGQADSIDASTGPRAYPEELDAQAIMDGLVLGDGGIHKASNNLVLLYIGVKDQDYFTSEIRDFIIRSRPGVSAGAHEVETTITANELPKTYDRAIPNRFFYGNNVVKQSFLRGLFTANGSISGNRITLKQTSRALIEQVQLMLSSLGISSYITVNRAKDNKFSNGTYRMKESYDLNITTDRDLFEAQIGFIQSYKKAVSTSSARRKINYDIKSVEFLGEMDVFDITVEDDAHTYWTGGCLVSNCTEVTSEDDSDICNLGSINLANINSEDEMRHAVKYGTLFLLAGTVYSELPYEKVEQVRSKNRRLGLGLMGIHEWLVSHGKKYNPDEDLRKLLEIYATSGEFSDWFADELGLSRPVKTRAIAPTGTIAIVAETTSGIEPIFCVAYKRRYKESRPDGKDITKFQYVIDPTAKRLIDKGVHPDSIEDAYSLSLDVERRVVMQHWLQRFVDHGISSTINLHDRITDEKEVRWFGEMLLKYLPGLRGITCYPDGARGGQPLSVVSYKTAMGHEGVVFEESEERCVGGACGI